ncbi:hypothetical protein NMY22_g335 [Coprinellus aureogranulatus]|nr:hypothetical protein NMY22_g335 [Coprinellus aureogranulatus]
MELPNAYRQPSQDLISLATPAIEYSEKNPHFQPTPHPTAPPTQPSRPPHSHRSHRPSLHSAGTRSGGSGHHHKSSRNLVRPPHGHAPSRSSRPPASSRIAWRLKPWLPVILYAVTTIAFIIAFALYRTELFALLDELSFWLRADESYGHAVLFFLIFLTTIPPIPLYSTLIILSGYTFGPWAGAIISYFAALLGALVVFIVSRLLFRDSIGKWLSSQTRIKRVVRAIEKRPKLLFLIRLAPYPYNVMNCLLAASPTLTLHTYTVCTALSLFKVIIHTSVGASIHSFRDYHVTDPDSVDDESNADYLARLWSIIGILLCLVILVYLSVVARRAVDEELDDDPIISRDSEETEAFLSASSIDVESGLASPEEPPMAEIPFNAPYRMVTSPFRPPLPLAPDTPASSPGRWS